MNNIEQAVKEINKFNAIVGNLKDIRNKLQAHANVVAEEGVEYLAAIRDHEGDEAVLKELCDVLYTALGAKTQLELLGFDVEGALLAVCENNMSKFCIDETEAAYTADWYAKVVGIDVEMVYDNDNAVWVAIDGNGKCRKKINYKPVDVSEFTPQYRKLKGEI